MKKEATLANAPLSLLETIVKKKWKFAVDITLEMLVKLITP